MKKQKLLSGEFARLCQVNKKTLFYYDEIDLFKPAIVEQNGYRYYTYDQIDEFSKIKALQSVGLSLNDIKNQLHSDNISQGIQTLYTQKKAVQKKIYELSQLENILNQKLLELEHYFQIGNNTIFIEECAEECLTVESVGEEGLIINYMTDGYQPGVILNYDDKTKEMIKTYKYQKAKQKGRDSYIKKKGKYVGIYFQADDKQVIECAQQAFLQIQLEDYLIESEIFLKDVASDFINFSNHLPFKLTVKLKE